MSFTPVANPNSTCTGSKSGVSGASGEDFGPGKWQVHGLLIIIINRENSWKYHVIACKKRFEMKGKLFFSITRIAKGIVPILQSSYVQWQPFINSQQIKHISPTLVCTYQWDFEAPKQHHISPNLECVRNHPAFGVETVVPGWVWCLPMHPQHGRHDGPSAWKFPGSKNGAGEDGGRKQKVSSDKKLLGILSYEYFSFSRWDSVSCAFSVKFQGRVTLGAESYHLGSNVRCCRPISVGYPHPFLVQGGSFFLSHPKCKLHTSKRPWLKAFRTFMIPMSEVAGNK